MPARILKKKLAIKLYFTNIGDPKFKCRCGTERKEAENTGSTTLVGHIQL